MNNVIWSNNISFWGSMKICIVSAKPKIGGKKKNLDKITKYISQEKADMYIFGELFLTGYFCRDDIRDVAEDKEGESIKKLRKMAKEHGCYIICGVPFKEREGIISNAALLFHPNGNVDVYRKTFLANFGPFEERFYFLPDNTLPVFDTKYGKVGICICYDIFFPEVVKSFALQGADLIICISASPSVTREFFEKVLPARAIENTVFIAYANLVGNQENLVFWGGGQAYDPKGELIAKGEYFKESYVIADIDFSLLENVRVSRPTIRDTKAEI
ncbi:MAG: carbon-nitrogen hydrolase family protein, partial [Thermoplasmata archaeon]